jgi:hypothetical protein
MSEGYRLCRRPGCQNRLLATVGRQYCSNECAYTLNPTRHRFTPATNRQIAKRKRAKALSRLDDLTKLESYWAGYRTGYKAALAPPRRRQQASAAC